MALLKPAEKDFWDLYLRSLHSEDIPKDSFVEASYAGTQDITDKLLRLYLVGNKTAGSSLKEDFLSAGDPLPKVGNFWIILNSKDEPKCIVKTIKIVENKFKDVPLGVAQAEGEGDLSLEYWRKVHTEFYSPFLKTWGVNDIDDATVITEFFEVVYK
ncbi:MAG: ASCH domain-containing protein [Bdellovibrionales bacterium]|nr:ASCH domain-containing protein [Bdellovibrionales bacterium]